MEDTEILPSGSFSFLMVKTQSLSSGISSLRGNKTKQTLPLGMPCLMGETLS